MFLGEGVGAGKNFFITAIRKYLKRVLIYPNPNLVDPSAIITKSAEKFVAGVNGITLRFALCLPVKLGLKSYQYKKQGDEKVFKC